jgi:hypothetical protein
MPDHAADCSSAYGESRFQLSQMTSKQSDELYNQNDFIISYCLMYRHTTLYPNMYTTVLFQLKMLIKYIKF